MSIGYRYASGATMQMLYDAIERIEREEGSLKGKLKDNLRRGDPRAVEFRVAQVRAWHRTGKGLQDLEALSKKKNVKHEEVRLAVMMLERRGMLSRPSTKTVALTALANVGDVQGATWFLDKIENPKTISFNVLLRACAKAGDHETAEAILNEKMKERGLLPDAVSYATAIGSQEGWNSNARKWMRTACEMGTHRGKLLACREGMRLCARSGDWDEAVRILVEVMPKYQVIPESRDFRETIHACASAGRVEAARQVLDLAVRYDLDSDATWARFVSACARVDEVQEAIAAYWNLAERRKPQSAVVANNVLKMLAGKADSEAAMKFLEDIREAGHAVDIETYSWTMRALRDDWRTCLDLLATARKAGLTITGDSCVPALESLAYAGESNVQRDLVLEMHRRKIELTDLGVAAIIRCKVASDDAAGGVLAFRADAKWAPEPVQAALDACAAARDAESAIEIFREFVKEQPKLVDSFIVKACAAAVATDPARWREVVDLVTREYAHLSRRSAYCAAINACLNGIPVSTTSSQHDDGHGEDETVSASSADSKRIPLSKDTIARLAACADCWDIAVSKGALRGSEFGKRQRVINVDVHGGSVQAACAAVIATMRRAYVANPEEPATLSVITGSSKRRDTAAVIQPAVMAFVANTFNMASRLNESNSGAVIIAAASIKSWGDKHPDLVENRM